MKKIKIARRNQINLIQNGQLIS